MADNPVVLDWDTAPEDFRKAYKAIESDLKKVKKDVETIATERQADQERLERYTRRERFEEAAKEAKVEGLTLEDLADVPTDQINTDMLKVKAMSKAEATKAAEEALAKAHGYENADEFRQALQQIKQANEAKQQTMAVQAQVATAPGSSQPTTESPEEKALSAYNAMLEKGKPHDDAQAEWMRAFREASAEKESGAVPAGVPGITA